MGDIRHRIMAAVRKEIAEAVTDAVMHSDFETAEKMAQEAKMLSMAIFHSMGQIGTNALDTEPWYKR